MPFLDDSGAKPEQERSPLVLPMSAFSAQIERLVIVNILWAAQLLPSLLVLSQADFPAVLKIAGVTYTLLALPPATGWLYGMGAAALRHAFINPDLARDAFRELWLPSYRVLSPLYGVVGVLLVLITAIDPANPALVLPDTLLRLLFLLWLTILHYFGPAFVARPNASAWDILRESILLVWRYPLPSLMMICAVVIAAFLGIVSIGGIFLAVPVLIVLLQTAMYNFLQSRRKS
jgi:hypothetical protein